MKKLVMLLTILFFITGCGNKVKCTYKTEDGKQTNEVVGKFKGDYLVKISYKDIVKASSADEAESLCSIVKESIKKNKAYDVECKKRKIIVENSTEVKKSEKITKEKFIEEYKKLNYSCK